MQRGQQQIAVARLFQTLSSQFLRMGSTSRGPGELIDSEGLGNAPFLVRARVVMGSEKKKTRQCLNDREHPNFWKEHFTFFPNGLPNVVDAVESCSPQRTSSPGEFA